VDMPPHETCALPPAGCAPAVPGGIARADYDPAGWAASFRVRPSNTKVSAAVTSTVQ